ncbi:MAG: serine/threonine-protein kinase [Candidatus Sumerlaeia bacterium]|nr:serine/threonine-protein kinase [Candidatus Sumerlaeia bacterium]
MAPLDADRPFPEIPADLPDECSITAPIGSRLVASRPAMTPLPGESGWDASKAPLPRWLLTALAEGPAGSVPSELVPPHETSFFLRRVVGEGGFGEIWESHQASLGRTVAIKRLHQDRLSRASGDPAELRSLEETFHQEALATANLEHPNIVPVYDLGRDERGRPALAMKLVRGAPWDRILRDDFGSMPVADFLSKHIPVLMDVSQAVAFAHSRGVVHRDLKPSQVMTGEFGEVLLMDWGIAMVYDEMLAASEAPALRETLPDRKRAPNPSGTPAYMAPEQTTQSAERIGPWTDVFQLGGILYFLLTGTSPYRARSANDAFKLARAAMIVPPRERIPQREVPSDLAALAMHALEGDRALRLQSASEFHDRLKDHLTGASRRRESHAILNEVRARLESSLPDYRDHGELLALLGNARTLWPENPDLQPLRDRALLRYANAALEHGDLMLARVQAERLSAGAERERLLAELTRLESRKRQQERELSEAFAQATSERDRAEDLLGFLIHELHATLAPLHRLDLMDQIARKALSYYESAPAEQDAATPARAANRAVAFRNIGDVLKNQARVEDALKAYRSFHATARAGHARHPNDEEWATHLSDAFARLAGAHYFQGEYASCIAVNNEALEFHTRRAAGSARPAFWRNRMAGNLHQLGVVYWRQGFQEKAASAHLASLAVREQLCEQAPEDVALLYDYAWVLISYSNVLRAAGRLGEALAVAERGHALRIDLCARQPDNPDHKVQLGWSLTTRAAILQDMGRRDDALELFREALPLAVQLAAADPTNASRALELAFTHGAIGRVLHELERNEEAVAAFREAVAMSQPLADQDSTHLAVLLETGWILNSMGEALLEMGRLDEARDASERVLGLAQRLTTEIEDNPTYFDLLSKALLLAGRVLHLSGAVEEAREHWERAVDVFTPFVAGRQFPSWQMETRASALLHLGRTEEAAPLTAELASRGWRRHTFQRLLDRGGA